MLLSCEATDLPADKFVAKHGDVFAVFDAATQDSGNVSYGARLGEDRLFVKTAGEPSDPKPILQVVGFMWLTWTTTATGRL